MRYDAVPRTFPTHAPSNPHLPNHCTYDPSPPALRSLHPRFFSVRLYLPIDSTCDPEPIPRRLPPPHLPQPTYCLPTGHNAMSLITPPQPPSARTAARLAALSDDHKENLKATSARSRFYDHQARGTIARRKLARSNYFQYCQTIYEIEEEEMMYSSDTLIGYVCGFLECMAMVSEGVLSDKVKASHIQIPHQVEANTSQASSLWQRKNAL